MSIEKEFYNSKQNRSNKDEDSMSEVLQYFEHTILNQSLSNKNKIENNLILQVKQGLSKESKIKSLSKKFKQQHENISSLFTTGVVFAPILYIMLTQICQSNQSGFDKVFFTIFGLTIMMCFYYIFFEIVRGFSPHFKWVSRWLKKWNKYKDYSMLKKEYENACEYLSDEKFQHEYMAHVQFNLKKYKNIKNQLLQTLDKNDFIIKNIDDDIDDLMQYQSILIENFTQKNVISNIDIIQYIENSLKSLEFNTQANQGYVQEKERFLNRYQDFLQKNNLEHALMEEESIEDENLRKIQDRLKKSL